MSIFWSLQCYFSLRKYAKKNVIGGFHRSDRHNRRLYPFLLLIILILILFLTSIKSRSRSRSRRGRLALEFFFSDVLKTVSRQILSRFSKSYLGANFLRLILSCFYQLSGWLTRVSSLILSCFYQLSRCFYQLLASNSQLLLILQLSRCF